LDTFSAFSTLSHTFSAFSKLSHTFSAFSTLSQLLAHFLILSQFLAIVQASAAMSGRARACVGFFGQAWVFLALFQYET